MHLKIQEVPIEFCRNCASLIGTAEKEWCGRSYFREYKGLCAYKLEDVKPYLESPSKLKRAKA